MSIRSGKWLVTKHDGLQKVWERQLNAYQFTPNQISELLRMLACTDLTSDEVINSVDPKATTGLLGVQSDHIGSYSCGENPYYTAKHIQ